MKLKWEGAPEWANWLAKDEDGEWWYYRDKPVLGVVGWRSSELSELCKFCQIPADKATFWEDSLMERSNE